jgi:hypothetical protein
MPKRRADASKRTFFDQYERIKASYFRARDVIDPAKNTALIPCANGQTKLLAVAHSRFPSGGGYSYFRCPQCSRRAGVLYLVSSNMPRCVNCCAAMNIKHRSQYGFGRQERMRAADLHLDQLIAKLESPERLRLKPAPASWGGRAQHVYRSRRLTRRMRRRMISLRLSQLASQAANDSGGLNITRAFTPRAEALAAIPELGQVWRARSTERLEQALDTVQCVLLRALESHDPRTQLIAARLMLKTRVARQRGLA